MFSFLIGEFSSFAQLEESETSKLISIGDAFLQSGNFEKSEQLYKDAIEAATNSNEKWTAVDRLCQIYLNREQPQMALDAYNEVLADSVASSDTTVRMYLLSGIGCAYYKMNDYVNSIKNYDLALNCIDGEEQRKNYKPFLYTRMAYTLLNAGDVNRAKVLLDTSLIQGKEMQDPSLLSSVYRAKASFHASIDEYESAYENMCLFSQKYEEVNNSRINSLINSSNPLSSSYNIEAEVKLQRQLKDYKLKYDELKVKIERSADFAYFICLTLLVSIVIVVWLIYVNWSRSKKINMMTDHSEWQSRVLANVAKEVMVPFKKFNDYSELQINYAMSINDSAYMESSRTIYNLSQTIYQKIGNALLWTQMDKLKEVPSSINLARTIERIVESFRLLAEEKNIHFAINIDDSIEALANHNHFNAILRNLLLNAIQYSYQNGRVVIEGVSEASHATITIEDNGPGIEQDVIDRVKKASLTPLEDMQAETKLGLLICCYLIKQNKGDIEIKSVLGRGTKIIVTLPK